MTETLKQIPRWLIIVLVAGICIAAVGLLDSEPYQTFDSDAVSFSYPSGYSEISVDSTVREDNSIELFRASREGPAGVISINKGDDVQHAAAVLKMSQLDVLDKNADSKLKLAYKGYEHRSSQRMNFNGRDALVREFSYIANDKKTTVYVQYIAIIAGENIYYVTVQSSDKSTLDADAQLVEDSFTVR